jgi:hypothetical protein
VSMETTTSSIIVLRPSFDDDSSFPTSMVVLEDQNFLGMIFHILLYQIDFGWFLMVAVGRFVIANLFSTATSSSMLFRALGTH